MVAVFRITTELVTYADIVEFVISQHITNLIDSTICISKEEDGWLGGGC